MSVLDMDIREHIIDIINAFTSVFGEDKKAEIGARINSGYYVAYNDIEGIEEYVRFLEDCKARELYIKFLNKIGIHTKYDEQENFTTKLDEETSHLIGKYIDKTAFEARDLQPLYGIKPFFIEYENPAEQEIARENKVNFINQFLGEEECGCLTIYDFDEFCETEQYQEFFKKLEPYKKAYDEIDEEYCHYIKEIKAEYQQYIDSEKKRKADFLEKVKKDRKVDLTEEELEELIKYSPSYQKYFVEGILSKDDEKKICACIVNKKTATTVLKFERGGATAYLPVVLYGARKDMAGALDYICLHETCHVLGQRGLNVGFDTIEEEQEKNKYDNQYRKYERLNENFTDMITIEALGYLRKNDKYMMEDKKHIKECMQNINTADITKKMLLPIFEHYRKDILQVMLSGEPEPFISKIGRDNFEELNDIINNVDNLCHKGLIEKIDKGKTEDELFVQHKEQLLRLKKLYRNIDIKIAKDVKHNEQLEERENVDR